MNKADSQPCLVAETSEAYVAEVAKMMMDMPEDVRKQIFVYAEEKKFVQELMRIKKEGEKNNKVG